MRLYKKILSLLLIALLVFFSHPASAQTDVSALFINVGKADAALFFLGDKRVLIDTGTKDSYDQLERVLDVYGIEHLDAVIITHTDKDHAGGLKKLLKSGMSVGTLYSGTLHSEVDLNDHRVIEASEKYDQPITWLSAGDRIDLGNECFFDVLGPLSLDMEKENNNSLVLRLTTPEGDIMLTGDMELAEEAELINAGKFAPAEVLKVPHHGEDDATSSAFALLIQAQWAVISTSTAEEPDTPDDKILRRLYQAGSSVAVTQDAEVGILILLEDGQASARQINWQ